MPAASSALIVADFFGVLGMPPYSVMFFSNRFSAFRLFFVKEAAMSRIASRLV